MNYRLALVTLCLVFAVGCGGSHSNSNSNSSDNSSASATAMPAGSSQAGAAMSGGAMGDTTKIGSNRHHGHAETAMTGSGAMQFPTESAATEHCPSDTVVWLNLKSKIYHLKGSAEYGTTKHGAYVCQQEANTAGDRAAKGGG